MVGDRSLIMLFIFQTEFETDDTSRFLQTVQRMGIALTQTLTQTTLGADGGIGAEMSG